MVEIIVAAKCYRQSSNVNYIYACHRDINKYNTNHDTKSLIIKFSKYINTKIKLIYQILNF